ncbi:NaeI family type II restriction endonuclease [Streptomyces niveus]
MLLLREIRHGAGLSVEALHERLRIDGQLAGRLPAISTFYARLKGTNLQNAGRLIDAVVRICARDNLHADELLARTQQLLREARLEGATADADKADEPGDSADARSELIKVQRQLIGIQAELAKTIKARAAAEEEVARGRNMATMLLLALAALEVSTDASANTVTGAEARALRSQLAEAEADRKRAHQAASAAQRRLAEVEELLAARSTPLATGTVGTRPPQRSGLHEWPTTRIEPHALASSNGVPVAAAGQSQPRTTRASADEDANPSETPTAGHQDHSQAEDPSQKDRALEEVLAEIEGWDPDGSRLRSVIDGAADHLLDPAHTGRYEWSQLTKVEKTALADAVGHRLRREFGLAPGERLDFKVAGHEVDVKFARRDGRWMFPPEGQGDLYLVVTADDEAGTWNVGLVRVLPELMRMGSNRDGKRGLSAEGRAAIRWIHRGAPLQEHALPQMSQEVAKEIFALKSAQARVDELLLQAVHRLVTRTDLKAVAMQTDFAKRLREARPRLATRGVLILAGDRLQEAKLAARLGLPTLTPGTWMSIRLAPAASEYGEGPTVTIGRFPWRLAVPDDPEVPLPTTSWTGPAA